MLINLWLRWVFVAVCGLPLGMACSRCSRFGLHRLLGCGAGLRGCGAQAQRCSCSVGCGIFPDQASSPCLLHWSQQDSLMTVLWENFAEESLSSPAEPLLPCFSAVLSLKLPSGLPLALPWELSGDQLAAQCVDAEPARASGPGVSEWPFVYIF